MLGEGAGGARCGPTDGPGVDVVAQADEQAGGTVAGHPDGHPQLALEASVGEVRAETVGGIGHRVLLQPTDEDVTVRRLGRQGELDHQVTDLVVRDSPSCQRARVHSRSLRRFR